jgi:hypothetical protein
MAKVKLEQARELIKAKRYDEARKLLEGIDHPTANKWLAKLAEIAPAPSISVPTKNDEKKKQGGRLRGCLIIILLLVVVYGVIVQFNQFRQTTDNAAVSAGHTLAAAGVIAGITSEVTVSATITDTPRVEVSLTPSVTITDISERTQMPTSTIDFDALEATSNAMSEPIRADLAQVSGIDDIKLVSVLVLDDGPSVTIDIASTIDTQEFVEILLEAVQKSTPNIIQFRVTISSNDGINGTNWLWENGREWSSASW